tara:strand:- start:18 stop:311 length:294 start_codon:yes stop_codon:yes gene_type:complete
MIFHIALGILGLFVLLTQLSLLVWILRVERILQASITLQLGLNQLLLTAAEDAQTELGIDPLRPGPKAESTQSLSYLSLQEEVDRFVTESKYAEEDD